MRSDNATPRTISQHGRYCLDSEAAPPVRRLCNHHHDLGSDGGFGVRRRCSGAARTRAVCGCKRATRACSHVLVAVPSVEHEDVDVAAHACDGGIVVRVRRGAGCAGRRRCGGSCCHAGCDDLGRVKDDKSELYNVKKRQRQKIVGNPHKKKQRERCSGGGTRAPLFDGGTPHSCRRRSTTADWRILPQ